MTKSQPYIHQERNNNKSVNCFSESKSNHSITAMNSSLLSLPPPLRHHPHRRRIQFPSLNIKASSSSSSPTTINSLSNRRVVVTRERGKNGKLIKALVISFCSSFLYSLFTSLHFYVCEIWCIAVAFLNFRLWLWCLMKCLRECGQYFLYRFYQLTGCIHYDIHFSFIHVIASSSIESTISTFKVIGMILLV